jgi:hypothetical protein
MSVHVIMTNMGVSPPRDDVVLVDAERSAITAVLDVEVQSDER